MRDWLDVTTPWLFYDIFAVGLAAVIIIADPKSRSSQALAAALAFEGLLGVIPMLLTALGYWQDGSPLPDSPAWIVYMTPENFSIIAFAEWFLLVMLTVSNHDRWTRFGIASLRIAQVTVLLRFAVPLLLANSLAACFVSHDCKTFETVWKLDRIALTVVFLTMLFPLVMLLVRKPDAQERPRIIAAAIAVAVIGIGERVFSDDRWFYIMSTSFIGLLIGLVGVMKYHVMQGQRSEFLARFLSPNVGERVRSRGLLDALQQCQREISIVCCDLRGFTAYSQRHSPEDVLNVLREYYNVVSSVASRYGATIKDIAGDGILILVGAPELVSNHAGVALDIADDIRVQVGDVLRQLPKADATDSLGIGIGVASGPVTVGVIDAAFRLEYAAVGPAVNLSSRLCSQSLANEIKVSSRTAELNHGKDLIAVAPAALKGIGDAVVHFTFAKSASQLIA